MGMSGTAQGIAIAADGTMLITLLDANDVVTGHENNPLALGPPINVHGMPLDVSLTPDARTAFVTLLDIRDYRVSIIDVASNAEVGMLPVSTLPMRVLVTPDGNHIYVTTTGLQNDTVSTLFDFDGHSHALIDTMVVGATANGITYDSTRNRLYVSSLATREVAEISVDSDIVLRRIRVGSLPQDIALTRDGAELWVAAENDGYGLEVYDVTSGTLLETIPNTPAAFGLKLSPDGAQFYLTRTHSDTLTVIDAHSRQVVRFFKAGFWPQRIAFNAIGSRAIITLGQDGIFVIE
jgi:YVTN family beta-propeller protein